jgi:hypothetical protein
MLSYNDEEDVDSSFKDNKFTESKFGIASDAPI